MFVLGGGDCTGWALTNAPLSTQHINMDRCCCFNCVNTSEVGIVENLGKVRFCLWVYRGGRGHQRRGQRW